MRQRNSESMRGREQPWLLRQFVRPVQPHIGENVALPQSLVIGGIIVLMFVAFVVLYNMVGGALAPSAPKPKTPAGVSVPSSATTKAPSTLAPTVAITATRAPGSSPVPQATALPAQPTVAPTAPPMGATMAPTVVPPAAGGTKYKVKLGDTLISIAAKYGVSVQSIMTANNMKNDAIYAGEELIIPPK